MTSTHPSLDIAPQRERRLPELSTALGLLLLLVAMTGCKPGATPESAPGTGTDSPIPRRPREVVVRTIEEYPLGVELGLGWRSSDAKAAPSRCVDFVAKQGPAQSTSFVMVEAEDKSSLTETFKVSSEVKWQAVVGNAKGKASFARNTELSIDSTYFSMLVRVGNSVHNATPKAQSRAGQPAGTVAIDLTPHYAALAKNDPVKFFEQCGDSYVHALYGGAELSAVITFKDTTYKERQELSSELTASAPTFGAEASGKLDQTFEKYSKSNRLQIAYQLAGGNGEPLPTNRQELLRTATNLAAAAAKAPALFNFDVIEYSYLPSWPGVDLPGSDWNANDVARQYGRVWTLFLQTDAILRNPSAWVLGRGVLTKDVQKLKDELLSHLQSIRATADECIAKRITDCRLKPADALSDYGFRARMPIPEKSFEFHQSVKAQQAVVAAAKAEATRLDNIREVGGGLPGLVAHQSAQRAAHKKVETETAKLTQMEKQYADELRSAIVNIWLRHPSSVRCKRNPQIDCIAESELEKFASVVKVT